MSKPRKPHSLTRHRRVRRPVGDFDGRTDGRMERNEHGQSLDFSDASEIFGQNLYECQWQLHFGNVQ